MRSPPLIILLALSTLACWISYMRFSKLRDDAEVAASSLSAVRRDLADIDRLRRAGARPDASALDAVELARELREAATAAGLPKEPDSEPFNPLRVGTTDYSETPVGLGFNPMTLKQLVSFLHHLNSADPTSRVRRIELRAPTPGLRGVAIPTDVRPEDLWAADVEVGFITHTPASGNPNTQRP